ncbi:hypothetical protein BDB00DRAFT_869413 [Zychaea mexicana]|uniref:uncharacterized protein n=1 Tax=Zychaea mexicana TaxID=64656 RepID=UPI0022FF1B6F|nr:uncharacterized protein BDB00DRAFT_869413 [Zychaea mexicana]KAI9496473.1 hypothetical protein BDB00DRAFT_869413 [Zychaea mexicana]
MIDTMRYWVFEDEMLSRTVGGAYHPLIHLAYEVEFNLPNVAAEQALAMAASATIEKNNNNGSKCIDEIINAIRTNFYFDDAIESPGKRDTNEVFRRKVLANPETVTKLREYATQWHFKVYGSPPSSLSPLDDGSLFLKAAQVTVDVTGKNPVAASAWNFPGVGFEETWVD